MLLTIIIFIFILGLLIFVHELGHFLVAKKAGAKVEEFGFGFPPRLFGKKIGETVYSINLIPLGGFVKIYGEDGQDSDNPKSFASKSAWQRFKILIAGVSMNVILAIILLSGGYIVGLPSIVEEPSSFSGPTKVQIVEIAPGSPAEESGLRIGDTIKEFLIDGQGQKIEKSVQFQSLVDAARGKEITLLINRGKRELQINVLARKKPPQNEGPIGIAMATVGTVSYPWYQAFIKGVGACANIIVIILISIFKIIKAIFEQGAPIGEIYGPVGIFGLTGQAAQMGFVYLLQLTALLSINLAIINAIPFPALDGGRILFLLIEKFKGSPVNPRVERLMHLVGFSLLILLMVVITFRDVARLF